MSSSSASGKKINLDQPRYDQSTYMGRAKHFLSVTNPMNILASERQLDDAARVVKEYRKTGIMPPFYNEDRLWRAKNLYDSAFHPDTGEKMIVFGRMAAQMPMNTLITGGMIVFYKSTPAVVFWQWLNQSFNALVNYTNRSGDKDISTKHLTISYLAATGSALGTALYLNNLTKTMSPIFGRLVPFAAVCAANCVNIPCMRSLEIIDGLPVFTKDGQRVGESRKAAVTAISLVIFSRIFMCTPSMTLTPFFMNYATRKGIFRRHPKLAVPAQLFIIAVCLTFATPLCCAIFDQNASLSINSVEPEIRKKAKEIDPNIEKVYFNKGL